MSETQTALGLPWYSALEKHKDSEGIFLSLTAVITLPELLATLIQNQHHLTIPRSPQLTRLFLSSTAIVKSSSTQESLIRTSSISLCEDTSLFIELHTNKVLQAALNNVPAEIIEKIIESLISEYPDPGRSKSDASTFLPRWYLTPLLRVCKMWYALVEMHLYRSISTGGTFPTRFTATDVIRSRSGRKVAVDLLATLLSNPRLSAMVRELRSGIDKDYHDRKTEKWARLNTRILRRCRNVKHVVICGFYLTDDDTLFDMLRQKSLISFCLRSRSFNTARSSRVIKPQLLYDAMQCWPKLRSIDVEFFWEETEREPLTYDTSQAHNFCPDLQEIILTKSALWADDFRALRAMCNGVTKLHVRITGNLESDRGAAALDALCECLRAWAFSLECISLTVRVSCQYQSLFKELSALSRLEELHISCEDMESCILGDPHEISRLDSYRVPVDQLDALATYLEEPEKFPVLRRFAAWFTTQTPRLEDACRKRNIQLRPGDEGDFKFATSPFLPFYVGNVQLLPST